MSVLENVANSLASRGTQTGILPPNLIQSLVHSIPVYPDLTIHITTFFIVGTPQLYSTR